MNEAYLEEVKRKAFDRGFQEGRAVFRRKLDVALDEIEQLRKEVEQLKKQIKESPAEEKPVRHVTVIDGDMYKNELADEIMSKFELTKRRGRRPVYNAEIRQRIETLWRQGYSQSRIREILKDEHETVPSVGTVAGICKQLKEQEQGETVQ